MIASLGFRLWLACGLAFSAAAAHAGGEPWTSDNYVNLYFRHYGGWVPLPHLRQPESKALFDQLVDFANITGIEQAPLSEVEKLRQLRVILALLGAYRAAYNNAVLVGEPLEEESTRIQIFAVEVAATVASHLRDSPEGDYSSAALATLVEGIITSIADTRLYTPRQGAAMANAIAASYPAIAQVLPEPERQRIRAKISKLNNETSDPQLQEALLRLRRTIMP